MNLCSCRSNDLRVLDRIRVPIQCLLLCLQTRFQRFICSHLRDVDSGDHLYRITSFFSTYLFYQCYTQLTVLLLQLTVYNENVYNGGNMFLYILSRCKADIYAILD